MARPKTIRSFIDELPESQRRQVVDAILSGQSLRTIAKIAGCCHTVIQDYKKRTILPALRKAQEIQSFQPLPPTNAEAVRQQAVLTRDIVQSSPFRERLEHLWNESQEALNRAKTAVRVVKDEDSGDLVAVGSDLTAIAPILNQAHKNVELLGRVTGEIEQAAGANIAIQVVLPSDLSRPAGEQLEPPAIDIGVIRR